MSDNQPVKDQDKRQKGEVWKVHGRRFKFQVVEIFKFYLEGKLNETKKETIEFINCRRTWITFAWTILGDWWGLEPYGQVLIFYLHAGSLPLQEVTRKRQEEPPLTAWGFPLSPDTSPRKATSFLKDKTDSRSNPPGTRDQLMWLSPKERGAPTKSRTWCPRREDIREPEKGSLIIICQDFRVKGITVQYQRKTKKEKLEVLKSFSFLRYPAILLYLIQEQDSSVSHFITLIIKNR